MSLLKSSSICLLFTALLISASNPAEDRAKAVQPVLKESFEKQPRLAILVGVGRYASLSPLRYPVADVIDLKTELERQGYEVHLLINNEATSDKIRTRTKELLKTFNQAEGTVLFFFTGHGFQNSAGQNYLATFGATLANLEQEGLAVSELEKILKDSNLQRQIIMLDACRNVLDAKAADTPRAFADFKDAEGLAVLYSTRTGFYSYEDPDLQHGIFTHFLLEALRGKAETSDGFITVRDLTKYLETTVYKYANNKGWIQKPFIGGEFRGDFLVATAGIAPAEPKVEGTKMKEQIGGEAFLLRGPSNQGYYLERRDANLVIISASTRTIFATLAEGQPTKMGPLFLGTTSDGEEIQLLVQGSLESPTVLNGKIGHRCTPQENCGGNSVQLPHETTGIVKKTENASEGIKVVCGVLGSLFGAAARDCAKVENSTDRARRGLQQVARPTHNWRAFNLAASSR